jgi:hypothetical protein
VSAPSLNKRDVVHPSGTAPPRIQAISVDKTFGCRMTASCGRRQLSTIEEATFFEQAKRLITNFFPDSILHRQWCGTVPVRQPAIFPCPPRTM